MTTITNGVVAQTSTKDVTTKFGTKKTYSFKLQGGDWYKSGFKDPKVNEGDVISFDFTEGTYGKDADLGSLRKTGTAPVLPTASITESPTRSSYGGKGVFPIPALDGQRSILRQNALTNARELFQQGKKEVAMDAATGAAIIAVARMFEAYTAGDLDLEEAVNEMASE